jgi:predicted AlkP superfamily pyrophosphatase or phosphodiesterase
MKWRCLALSIAVLALLPSVPQVSMASEPPKGRATHVVLISIDGLAASYFDDPCAEMPTLHMLAKKGAAAKE